MAEASTATLSDKRKFDPEKLLEAALELGRNWTIAVVVASFTTAYWYQDIALQPMPTREAVFYLGAGFALLWMGLGILRFMFVARFEVKTTLQTWTAIAIITFLVFIGGGLMLSVARFTDNSYAVATCSTYADKPAHKLHHIPVCQRLYEFRAAKERRMMGD